MLHGQFLQKSFRVLRPMQEQNQLSRNAGSHLQDVQVKSSRCLQGMHAKPIFPPWMRCSQRRRSDILVHGWAPFGEVRWCWTKDMHDSAERNHRKAAEYHAFKHDERTIYVYGQRFKSFKYYTVNGVDFNLTRFTKLIPQDDCDHARDALAPVVLDPAVLDENQRPRIKSILLTFFSNADPANNDSGLKKRMEFEWDVSKHPHRNKAYFGPVHGTISSDHVARQKV